MQGVLRHKYAQTVHKDARTRDIIIFYTKPHAIIIVSFLGK